MRPNLVRRVWALTPCLQGGDIASRCRLYSDTRGNAPVGHLQEMTRTDFTRVKSRSWVTRAAASMASAEEEVNDGCRIHQKEGMLRQVTDAQIVFIQRHQCRDRPCMLGNDRRTPLFGGFEKVGKLVASLFGSFAGSISKCRWLARSSDILPTNNPLFLPHDTTQTDSGQRGSGERPL